jgi:hypothetical protein
VLRRLKNKESGMMIVVYSVETINKRGHCARWACEQSVL